MNLNSRSSLIARLWRGRRARQQFVESHLLKTLAFQVRALRQREGWTQEELGKAANSTQNGVYRLEAGVGSPTLTTLKKIAAAFDVALVVRFVPYGELVDWVSGTPRLERGLRTRALVVPTFAQEFKPDSATPEQRDHITSISDVPLRMVKAEATGTNTASTDNRLPFDEAGTDEGDSHSTGDTQLLMEAAG